jgi:hypothetical protein
MRCDANKLTESVFAIVLFGTLGTIAMLALGHQIEGTRPTLGDIVSFSNIVRGQQPPLVLSAERPGTSEGGTCALDTGVMATSGGSLFVEARNRGMPEGFRVHWAGGPTSTGARDCGANSELVLSAHQLEELAAVAGGFGASSAHGAKQVHGASSERRADLQAVASTHVAAE